MKLVNLAIFYMKKQICLTTIVHMFKNLRVPQLLRRRLGPPLTHSKGTTVNEKVMERWERQSSEAAVCSSFLKLIFLFFKEFPFGGAAR